MTDQLAEINNVLALVDKQASENGSGQLNQVSEDDLAIAFSQENADTLCYIAKWGKWYRWDSRVWVEDDTLAVYDAIRQHIRQAVDISDQKSRITVLRAQTVAAVEKLIRSDRRHAATVDQWDADPWVINSPSGIVDLTTGITKDHESQSYLTKLAGASLNGHCPLWLGFLDEVTHGDEELIAFLQRWIGYCLTGSTREHVFALFYGTGANGKGTFLNTLTGILGDYATVAPMETFTESLGDRHPADLAMLRGARFVVAQESESGRRWAEAKLKSLTGGDPVTARFMRQDFFTYTPQFKLNIATNHKPQLRNVDEAMRRRILLIPFTVTIPPENRDPTLAEKLQLEWNGIFKWAVEGCLQYQSQGLQPPAAVLEATEEYFQTQNSLLQWLEECCERGDTHWETPTRLFNSWREWAKANNEEPGNAKALGDKLEVEGLYRKKRNGTRMHIGVKLNDSQGH